MTQPALRDRVVFALCVAVNLAVLYWPRSVGDGGLPHLDKLVHATVFAAVARSGLRVGVRARWLALTLVVHALASEAVQHWLLPARSGDPADVFADLAGVAAGLIGGSCAHDRARQRRADRQAAGGQPGAG